MKKKHNLGLSLDISSSSSSSSSTKVHDEEIRHKGHKLFNLAIRNVSTKSNEKRKNRFALDELDFEEINRTSSLNRSKSTPEGPTMSLNATTFRFRTQLVVRFRGHTFTP